MLGLGNVPAGLEFISKTGPNYCIVIIIFFRKKSELYDKLLFLEHDETP